MKRWLFRVTPANLAGAIFFLAATYFMLQALPILRHFDGVLTRAEAVESKVYATAGNIDKGTATWAGAAGEQSKAVLGLVADVRSMVPEARKAVQGANGIVATINDPQTGLGPLLASSKAVVDTLPPAVKELTATTAAMRGPLNASTDTLNAATLTFTDVHKAFNDPYINSYKKHLDSMLQSGDSIAADGAYKIHQFTHPPKVKLTFWGGMWAAAKYVHQFEPPIF